MKRFLFLAAACLVAAPTSAGFNYDWPVPGAQFDVPATFHFGLERAGMTTGVDITLTDQDEHVIDLFINADNADSYGLDWDLLQTIAGGPQTINYLGWWEADVPISHYISEPIPPGTRHFGGGANQPNFYPSELRLTLASSPANKDLFLRMIVTNTRGVPEPASLALLLLALPAGLIRRRSP